jgi:hypothetical protein
VSEINITVDVEGLTETIALLQKAPKDIVARGFFKAAQAGANIIADVLESNTPIKEEDTGGLLERGELRELLMISIEVDSQFRGVSADIGFGPRGGRVANFLEYGHRILPHAPPKPRNSQAYLSAVMGDVAPNPFMRKSFDASAEAAIDAFTESLKMTLAEEFSQASAA